MAIKIGHASGDEYGRASGGKAGDQTQREVCTRTWYNGRWDVVLRPKDAALAEKSAKACEAACANPKIGYDQMSRNTLNVYAKLVNYDLSKVADECECDCSSLMHVCAIAGGANLKYGYNGFWTGNMVDGIMASGQYEKLTEAKYLTSDAYLKRGDILIRTSGHTAMALENGSKAGEKTTATTTPVKTTVKAVNVTVSLPLLKKGAEGASVEVLQTLLTANGFNTKGVDGEFGNNTLAALKAYQSSEGLTADGECGKNTWTCILTK